MSKSSSAWDAWRRLGSPKYVVAPMVDGSELAFRDLCRKYGATLAYTPMLNSRMFSRDAKYRAEHFSTNKQDRPLAAQFCANDAKLLVEAARYVEDSVDAIDLNLGCPQGIARRGHYGAFLQDEWELLEEIVSTASKELCVPIWCKIRIFPQIEKTIQYAQMLEKAGASLIAVHGRTREQKGKGAPPADWNMIEQVRQAVNIPVIANGNVRTLHDADEAIKVTGAQGVMSAWALLDNPATFLKDKEKQPSRMELAKEYLDLAEKYQTPARMIKLHLFKMFRSRLDYNMDLNQSIAKCSSISQFRAAADSLAERCDFDGISFEQRLASGNAPKYVICEKREKRMKLAQERKETEKVSELIDKECKKVQMKPLAVQGTTE